MRALPRGTSSDKIEFVRTQPRSIGEPQVVAAGFDWSDGAIGAGLALGLVLLGWGAARGDASRRSRPDRLEHAGDGRQVVSGPQGPLTTASASISTSQRGVEQPAGEKRCVRRADVSEDLSVGAADALEVVGPHQVDAGADDVRERGARLLEGGADDLEAAPGLAVGVLGRIGAVGHDGRGAGHVHVLADADGAREADDGLVR